jgi:hypothetical protein
MDQDAESSTFPVGTLFQNADDFGTDAVDQSRWDSVPDSLDGDEVARERTAVSERALLGWAGEKSGLTIGYSRRSENLRPFQKCTNARLCRQSHYFSGTVL